MHTDPIADLLTRIRNGGHSGAPTVEAPSSKVKLEVLRILQSEGFIKGFENIKEAKFPRVRVFLKYEGARGKQPAISHLQRVSRPGLRRYRKAGEVRPVLHGLGVAIVSTSKGIMTDRAARKSRLGGEIMCEVW